MCECVPCHMALFRSSSSFVCNIHLAMHDFAVVVVGCPFLSVTFKLIILFIDSHSHARPKNFTIKCNMSSEFFLSKFYAHQKIFENFFFLYHHVWDFIRWILYTRINFFFSSLVFLYSPVSTTKILLSVKISF